MILLMGFCRGQEFTPHINPKFIALFDKYSNTYTFLTFTVLSLALGRFFKIIIPLILLK